MLPYPTLRAEWVDPADVRAVWRRLLRVTRGAGPLHGPEWLDALAGHPERPVAPRVLLVRDGHAPVGLVPLVARQVATPLGPLNTLTLSAAPTGHGTCGAVGSQPTVTWLAAARLLTGPLSLAWDRLDLGPLVRGGPDHGRLLMALRRAGLAPVERTLPARAVLRVAGPWRKYWAARPDGLREEVVAARARLRAEAAALGERLRCVRLRPRGAPTTCDGATNRPEYAALARAGGVERWELRAGSRLLAALDVYRAGELWLLADGREAPEAGPGALELLMANLARARFRGWPLTLDLGPLSGRLAEFATHHEPRVAVVAAARGAVRARAWTAWEHWRARGA